MRHSPECAPGLFRRVGLLLALIPGLLQAFYFEHPAYAADFHAVTADLAALNDGGAGITGFKPQVLWGGFGFTPAPGWTWETPLQWRP